MSTTAPPSPPLQNPLWEFSLDFYLDREVAEFLLDCQDRRGADVCLLLWASYLASCGRQLSEESWRAADRDLAPRRRMIVSVRNIRRWLGRLRPRGRGVYGWFKRCELKLEQRQLATLWKLQGEPWPEDRPALELAGRQYGLLRKDQARWAGLIERYRAGAE